MNFIAGVIGGFLAGIFVGGVAAWLYLELRTRPTRERHYGYEYRGDEEGDGP